MRRFISTRLPNWLLLLSFLLANAVDSSPTKPTTYIEDEYDFVICGGTIIPVLYGIYILSPTSL